MGGQRGQASVEWTGAVLLVAIVLAAGVLGAKALGAGGLPQRLVCALLGERCPSRDAFAPLDQGPPRVFYAHAPVHQRGGLLPAAVALAPAALVAEPVIRFVKRHRRRIRQVVVATAIGVGVAATCAGAVVAANAIGATMCASSIVTGAYAGYRNATS